jgi:hypothetical protein
VRSSSNEDNQPARPHVAANEEIIMATADSLLKFGLVEPAAQPRQDWPDVLVKSRTE